MGMDLIGTGLSYNWHGWYWLVERLASWGVDVSEFRFTNDGAPILEETCRAVADAINQHLHDLDAQHRDWIEPHIEIWRECGGCEQW